MVDALPPGLKELVEWLLGHRVTAAVMEATGIYWQVVHTALERATIRPLLVHARHVKQLKGRKTDVTDSVMARTHLSVRPVQAGYGATG